MCVAHLEIRKNNTEEDTSVYKGGAELAYVAILVITSAIIYLDPHMIWPGILAPAKGWHWCIVGPPEWRISSVNKCETMCFSNVLPIFYTG